MTIKRPEKARRQAALMRLVRSRPLENQEQIVALMRQEGLKVTQASVSRDICELGLVKLAGRYVQAKKAMNAAGDLSGKESQIGLIVGVEPVGANLVVVRTRVGAANSVAVVLDRDLKENISGTIAGDDTIFIAVRSRCDQGLVVGRVNAWMRQSAAFPPG
ncbi:MAG: arginine repressor [Pirellulaceae bacterium]|nr:arginine repressor [Pirellulaceae bacterium]